MPLAQKLNHLNIPDYLQGEKVSEIKHEYVDGQVLAMAGASVNHHRISRNLLTRLSAQLPASCEAFVSDMLIKTSATRFRYPDLVVLCEDTEGDQQFVGNPVLIIEVLSKSTRQQDKGHKRTEYLSLPSLQEYLLVEQDFVEVEILRRSQAWRPENYYLGATVTLESIGVTLTVEEIYQRVDNADMVEWGKQAESNAQDDGL